MDVESRRRWEDYTRAKEQCSNAPISPKRPWWVVEAVDKKKARLNCIAHLLTQISYDDVPKPPSSCPIASAMPITSAIRFLRSYMCQSAIRP